MVDWTRIADIATAVVVVALAMVERHRILPGFCSGLGEGHRRFLMLVAGGVLILKLISIQTSNGFDPTGIKRPWACISFIRGTSLRLDAW